MQVRILEPLSEWVTSTLTVPGEGRPVAVLLGAQAVWGGEAPEARPCAQGHFSSCPVQLRWTREALPQTQEELA